MKINIKKEVLPIIIIILSVVSSFYFYNKFPNTVATHWNFKGEVDGYSSSFIGAFMMPILLVIFYFAMLYIPEIDPKKDKYKEFENIYRWFRIVFLIVMFGIYIMSSLYNLGYKVDINIWVPILVGGMMIFLGSCMGKIKNNYFFGIKTPWTLSSENVWDKTHKFGGYVFIIFGLLIIILPFLNKKLGIIAFFSGVLLTTLGTSIYSYIIYRQENNKNKS